MWVYVISKLQVYFGLKSWPFPNCVLFLLHHGDLTFPGQILLPVLLYWVCHRLGDRDNRNVFLVILEAGSLASSCVFWGLSPWLGDATLCLHGLPCVSVSSSPVLTRTPGVLGEGPVSWSHFNFLPSVKTPSPIQWGWEPQHKALRGMLSPLGRAEGVYTGGTRRQDVSPSTT